MKPDLDQQVLDTKIQAKINAVHRGAFVEKFPGQVEHLLRLLTERLQHGLDKRVGVIITDPNTWVLTPAEIEQMSVAMYNVYQIYKDIRDDQSLSTPPQRHE